MSWYFVQAQGPLIGCVTGVIDRGKKTVWLTSHLTFSSKWRGLFAFSVQNKILSQVDLLGACFAEILRQKSVLSVGWFWKSL